MGEFENAKNTLKRIRDAYPQLEQGVGIVADALASIERERARLAARVAELEGTTAEPDPPVVVDPPPPVVGGDVPDFSEFAFFDRMPLWVPYARPTEGDCDWIIQDGIATSRRGLGLVHADGDGSVAGHAYRLSRQAGHGPRVTIGVRGWGGAVLVGGFYGPHGGGDVAWHADGAWQPIDLQVVGLDPTATIRLSWGGFPGGEEWGRTERLAVFGVTLRQPANIYGITASRECGTIILDDWAIEQPPEGKHNGALHIANWGHLVIRRMRRRAQFQRHALYLKSSDAPGSTTWVVDCDLRGGNQTGVQKRPGRDEAYLAAPADAFVVADCMLDEHGWDHEQPDGGGAISVWSAPSAPVFILRNRARDVRYSALVVSGQPYYMGRDRNWCNARGYPIGEVYVAGNEFSNPRSQRHCVSVSNTERLIFGDNAVDGSMVIDSQWAMENVSAPRVGHVRLLDPAPSMLRTYDTGRRQEVSMNLATRDTWEDVLR